MTPSRLVVTRSPARPAALALMLAAATVVTPATGQSITLHRLSTLVDSLAAAELAGGPTAGMSIAVWRRGELLLARGYGTANLEQGHRATAETVYRIGSVTKQFTAAALLQLVDQGRVRLDEDIRTYLPDFDTGAHRVTVSRILDHTSGIRSYTALGPAFGRDSFRLAAEPARIAGWLRGRPFDFAPGTGWRYNNSGFLLAGMIIERVSGLPYAEYLRRHIVEPLGLAGTGYCDPAAIVPHRASGYVRGPAGFRNGIGESMAIPHAAGAVCSTVLDLVRFRAALSDGTLISPGSYRRMIEPAVLQDGRRTNYGYGLARYRLGDVEVIRHGGSITGFQANLAFLPEEQVIVAALANTSGSDPVGVTDQILRAMTGQPLAEALDRPVTAALGARLAGRYRYGSVTVTVEYRDGGLTLGPPGEPARLVWQGGERFAVRPGFALGFYGSEVLVSASGGDLILHHPLGGTVVLQREGR